MESAGELKLIHVSFELWGMAGWVCQLRDASNCLPWGVVKYSLQALMRLVHDSSIQRIALMSMNDASSTVTSPDGQYTVQVIGLLHNIQKKEDDDEIISVYGGLCNGRKCVVKVFLLLDRKSSSQRAKNEVAALQRLTQAKCGHAPELITHFPRDISGILATREYYVVMTFFDGPSLCEWRREKGLDLNDLAALDRARKPFRKAICAVHHAGVDNGSYHAGNLLLWLDPNRKEENDKCWIIDFERATFDRPFARLDRDSVSLESWAALERTTPRSRPLSSVHITDSEAADALDGLVDESEDNGDGGTGDEEDSMGMSELKASLRRC